MGRITFHTSRQLKMFLFWPFYCRHLQPTISVELAHPTQLIFLRLGILFGQTSYSNTLLIKVRVVAVLTLIASVFQLEKPHCVMPIEKELIQLLPWETFDKPIKLDLMFFPILGFLRDMFLNQPNYYFIGSFDLTIGLRVIRRGCY